MDQSTRHPIQRILSKIPWLLFALLSTLVGLYPLLYLSFVGKFNLLNTKGAALLESIPWNMGFYSHVILGGIALLVGWMQFSKCIRARNIRLHRLIGKVYVVAVLISGLGGLYVGFFATGGIISAVGFICLAVIWLYTTLFAYFHIRKGRIAQHEKMMYYSFAACFAAVTLRLWLPILIISFGDFITAYRIVAWLCWVPNLVVAYFLVKRL